MTVPPKPPGRPGKVSLWKYAALFRRDILSAQPEKLYRAKMAEFRTPFFRSFLINETNLIDTVLRDRPGDFPKSDRVGEGLFPLLGKSVFTTNGALWRRQRRIIDPVFEGGRLRDSFPAMAKAGLAGAGRITPGVREVEEMASHMAADVIFRTMFSMPIEDRVATQVFQAFRDYQRSSPILNLAAFVPLPRWFPRPHRRRTRRAARAIRHLLRGLVEARIAEVKAGTAPDDLVTRLLQQADPETGDRFDGEEMLDQVAIFFLAGHETSASSLAWALYLLATHPDAQARVAAEAASLPDMPAFADLSRLAFTRDVFREALRLYPPVPMMVRENRQAEVFRNRKVPKGSQIVLSPWHLHRNGRYWDAPDEFDPDRFKTENGKACLRDAFIPFSAGERVCIGAGFGMIEGPLLLALILRRWRVAPAADRPAPMPVAHLTVRAENGIWLSFEPRGAADAAT